MAEIREGCVTSASAEYISRVPWSVIGIPELETLSLTSLDKVTPTMNQLLYLLCAVSLIAGVRLVTLPYDAVVTDLSIEPSSLEQSLCLSVSVSLSHSDISVSCIHTLFVEI